MEHCNQLTTDDRVTVEEVLPRSGTLEDKFRLPAKKFPHLGVGVMACPLDKPDETKRVFPESQRSCSILSEVPQDSPLLRSGGLR